MSIGSKIGKAIGGGIGWGVGKGVKWSLTIPGALAWTAGLSHFAQKKEYKKLKAQLQPEKRSRTIWKYKPRRFR